MEMEVESRRPLRFDITAGGTGQNCADEFVKALVVIFLFLDIVVNGRPDGNDLLCIFVLPDDVCDVDNTNTYGADYRVILDTAFRLTWAICRFV